MHVLLMEGRLECAYSQIFVLPALVDKEPYEFLLLAGDPPNDPSACPSREFEFVYETTERCRVRSVWASGRLLLEEEADDVLDICTRFFDPGLPKAEPSGPHPIRVAVLVGNGSEAIGPTVSRLTDETIGVAVYSLDLPHGHGPAAQSVLWCAAKLVLLHALVRCWQAIDQRRRLLFGSSRVHRLARSRYAGRRHALGVRVLSGRRRKTVRVRAWLHVWVVAIFHTNRNLWEFDRLLERLMMVQGALNERFSRLTKCEWPNTRFDDDCRTLLLDEAASVEKRRNIALIFVGFLLTIAIALGDALWGGGGNGRNQ